MGQIAKLASLAYQIGYIQVYLSVRSTDNSYTDWIDISRYVVRQSIGKYSKSIDSDDFDIGFYEESNITLVFDNSDADFNEGMGFFTANKKLDRSKIKIHAGYIDPETKVVNHEVVFEGLIDDRGTDIDEASDSIKLTVVSYASIINRLRAESVINNGVDFKTAIYNLLNVEQITPLLTVELANINPPVNETIDDANWFVGKQLGEAINKLLLASNSVMKITNNIIYVVPRDESASVRFQFYGKGSLKPPNIVDIKSFNNGLKRVITRAQVNDHIEDAGNDTIDLYGARLKKLDIGFVNNFEKERDIATAIITEFSVPKKELELTTDYIGAEVDLLDMVTIDNEGNIEDQVPAVYGKAIYGTSTYVKRSGSVRISETEGYKILSIQHDYQSFTTTLKLRSIGNREYDNASGYKNPVYGQATYGTSRYAVGI